MKQCTETAFPVPTVRLIVTDAEGRVLILQRRDCKYGDRQWCLPGGKVDYGETVEQAVHKELKEETALDCLEAQFLFYQDSLPLQASKMHCINLYFVCRTVGDLQLNEESIAFRWISREQLAETELVFRNEEGLARYWQLS